MAERTLSCEFLVGNFLPLDERVLGLLQLVLSARHAAFLVRALKRIDSEETTAGVETAIGFLLAIGAAKEVGDAFAEANKKGWFNDLLEHATKGEVPIIDSCFRELCGYCDKGNDQSLLRKAKSIRDRYSFHTDRSSVEKAYRRIEQTVQSFQLISPGESKIDSFLESLISGMIEPGTGISEFDMKYLRDEMPDFVSKLTLFSEVIYNLLIMERVRVSAAQPAFPV